MARFSFVLLSAGEWYLVQSATLPDELGAAPYLRALLDFAFLIVAVTLFSRRGLLAMAAMVPPLAMALLAYHRMFGRALPSVAVIDRFSEGASMWRSTFGLVPTGTAALLLLSLVMKVVLLRGVGRPARRWLPCSIAAYALAFALTYSYRPLPRLCTFMEFDSMAAAYGYFWPWAYDAWRVSPQQLRQQTEAGFAVRALRLSTAEKRIPASDRLVVIQVESLDFDVLGRRTEDRREVTPFLNSLLPRAMVYRVQPIHFVGSADADFTLLADRLPSKHVVTWKIPGLPLAQLPSLPMMLRKKGYATWALHGHSGRFFERERPYSEIGFDHLLFRHRLTTDFAKPRVRNIIQDSDVFAVSNRLFREEKGRQFHFIITLSSHAPYDLFTGDQPTLYPQAARAWQRYLNAMHYVDHSLADYVDRLPTGTTVILYGDHESKANYPRHPARTEELVPFLVFRTGEDWSHLQQTRGGLAQSGLLTLHDAADWLHQSAARF